MKPDEPDEPDGPDAAWAAARAAEPAGMDRDELAALLGNLKRARGCLDAIEVRAARRTRELAAVGRSEPAESLLANAAGHDSRDAGTIGDRDTVCDEIPDVESALDEGELTAGHVDAIAAARNRLPDDLHDEFDDSIDGLIARAGRVSLDTFRRECRQLAGSLIARSRPANTADELAEQRAASTVTRWIDKQTGMHHTHLSLDPLRDAKLAAAFNAELARLRNADTDPRRSWQQLCVDAFVNAVAGIATPDATGGESDEPTVVDRVPEITALVSYDWLIGQAEGGICETDDGHPLPIATVRRLCCDAEIIPTVLGGNGEVLDQGRARRTANRAQRRALRAMHRTCAHPYCTVGFSACRIHHIRWWWRDRGPTDIANLLPLCERHHHLVHEGGWTLTMTPDRDATWTRPDGTIHHTGTTIDRTPTPDNSTHAERRTRPTTRPPDRGPRSEQRRRTTGGDGTEHGDHIEPTDVHPTARADTATDVPEPTLL